MRRMLCLILASMLMLSHGSMGAAVPHMHVGVSDHYHAVADRDLAYEHTAVAAVEIDAHDDFGQSELDESGESDDGVTAHVHIVGGLAHVPATGRHPINAMPVAPLPAVTRLLVSREVAPLLEPPTA